MSNIRFPVEYGRQNFKSSSKVMDSVRLLDTPIIYVYNFKGLIQSSLQVLINFKERAKTFIYRTVSEDLMKIG